MKKTNKLLFALMLSITTASTPQLFAGRFANALMALRNPQRAARLANQKAQAMEMLGRLRVFVMSSAEFREKLEELRVLAENPAELRAKLEDFIVKLEEFKVLAENPAELRNNEHFNRLLDQLIVIGRDVTSNPMALALFARKIKEVQNSIQESFCLNAALRGLVSEFVGNLSRETLLAVQRAVVEEGLPQAIRVSATKSAQRTSSREMSPPKRQPKFFRVGQWLGHC